MLIYICIYKITYVIFIYLIHIYILCFLLLLLYCDGKPTYCFSL